MFVCVHMCVCLRVKGKMNVSQKRLKVKKYFFLFDCKSRPIGACQNERLERLSFSVLNC